MTNAFPLLVNPDWLHQHLDTVKVLDCTTHMIPQPVGPSKIESGRPDFDRAHIPGARHVDMVHDLSDPNGEFPYTLPAGEQIERLLGSLRITEDDHIVLYTSTPLMVATRAWYVLRALGHVRVSILNGGLAAWVSAGLPVERSDAPGHDAVAGVGVIAGAATYKASPDQSRYASKEDVAAATASGDAIVVNALSAEQHAGTGGAHYGRPGRIAGSVSVPTASILTDEGRSFAPTETIRAQFAAQGITPGSHVITYCGGGIAATVDAFALALIEHDRWAVYDNSLLEWSIDPAAKMETD